jgi:hypothetical protein
MLCSLDGCEKPKRKRGLCSQHYEQWRRVSGKFAQCKHQGCPTTATSKGFCYTHYTLLRRARSDRPACIVADCTRVEEATGLCYPHYQQARRYRLTPHDFAQMLDASIGCEICGSDADLFVDHNHATGEVRGLLCTNCNFVLGHAQENPDRLLAAAAYLLRSVDVLTVI